MSILDANPTTALPAVVAPSLQDLHRVDDSSVLSARRTNVPTETHKNITPEPLVPYNAPIQPRKYHLPLATSRKELPATFAWFAWKHAPIYGPGEEEGVRSSLRRRMQLRQN
ncbi:hypothetical protein BC827DRAFT_862785 [Russula dissimulans]|nr:hypothetical protein BC827DRAFT_862785 [Russula dissimulans]